MMPTLTPLAMVLALIASALASVAGGAAGGLLVGGPGRGNELAAMLGAGSYSPLTLPPTRVGIIVLAIIG